jgi:glycosyltransferase involved in cell wall biosynthesis
MRILLVTPYVPHPANSGGRIHVSSQIAYLSQEHDVTLMCPVRRDSGQAADARKLAEEYPVKVKAIPWSKRSKIRFLPHLFRYVRGGEPIGNLFFYLEELAEALRLITAQQHFDVVNIHHDCMAPYVDSISPQCRCKTVLSLQNVPYIQWRRMLLVERNLRRTLTLLRDLPFQKHATLQHIGRYDQTIVISETDRSSLLKDAPGANIVAVPAGINTDVIRPLNEPAESCDLMLVGSMGYWPNVDAAQFLCREIFPLVVRDVPDAHLFIVGSKPPNDVLRLAEQMEGITVTGYVDSVVPYYEQCCLTLVPLRAGSGIRVKILESLALGRPVVSTTLGCEGLRLTHDRDILIADEAAAFAEYTVRLTTDQALWQRLVSNGRRQIEQVYDWRVTGRKLVQAFEENGRCM